MKKYFNIKNIIFLILVIFLIYMIPKISNIIMLFFAAYVIACALNPLVIKMQKKISRNAASIIAVTLSTAAVFALFLPIFLIAYKEIGALINYLPQKVMSLFQYLSTFSIFGHKLSELVSMDKFVNASPDVAQNIVNHSWTFTMGIFQIFVVIVALTMIIYYLLVDKDYLKQKFIEFFPPVYKEKASEILSTISRRVGGFVRAQIISMVAVGLMMTIVLMILGIDYSFLLGLITGVLDIVPLLGPTIALIAILLVAYPLSIFKIILIIAGFLLVQQLSNYLVRPILFGKFMQLHPLMIFLALFLAEQFLGFWGVILSPAIAAMICVLIDELYLAPINETSQKENADAQ
ncbi:AI-2E family transporter [Spirochaetes bacterium]|uniref:AI-2E family transporter n=1 Tax=Candidatus Scatousia excrementipullorum TaxID=2840936 RepID=A0A9D9GY23_9BACT|nr:AI-2E family transporter [Candidatus Scatousia excrementipullorum]